MKRLVEIEPVCPFLGGKPCIKDGWKWNTDTYHPCAFWDERVTYSEYPDEPCRIKRAVDRILSDEAIDTGETTLDVPWSTEGDDSNGRT